MGKSGLANSQQPQHACLCGGCAHNIGIEPSKNGIPKEVECDVFNRIMLIPHHSCDQLEPAQVDSTPFFASRGLPHLKLENFLHKT